MAIDPDELKVRRIKREQQVHDVQKYMEEQEALDKQSAAGKMGHREVKEGTSIGAKISDVAKTVLNFLKGK